MNACLLPNYYIFYINLTEYPLKTIKLIARCLWSILNLLGKLKLQSAKKAEEPSSILTVYRTQ